MANDVMSVTMFPDEAGYGSRTESVITFVVKFIAWAVVKNVVPLSSWIEISSPMLKPIVLCRGSTLAFPCSNPGLKPGLNGLPCTVAFAASDV